MKGRKEKEGRGRPGIMEWRGKKKRRKGKTKGRTKGMGEEGERMDEREGRNEWKIGARKKRKNEQNGGEKQEVQRKEGREEGRKREFKERGGRREGGSDSPRNGSCLSIFYYFP